RRVRRFESCRGRTFLTRSGLRGVDDLLVALVDGLDDGVVVALVDGLADLLGRLADGLVDTVEVEVVDDCGDRRGTGRQPLLRVHTDGLLLVTLGDGPGTGTDPG